VLFDSILRVFIMETVFIITFAGHSDNSSEQEKSQMFEKSKFSMKD